MSGVMPMPALENLSDKYKRTAVFALVMERVTVLRNFKDGSSLGFIKYSLFWAQRYK
jgi:hypothetical protein